MRGEEEQLKKMAVAILLDLVFVYMFLQVFVPSVKATGTIYIRNNGNVDPPNVPILNVANSTYTFTDDILVDADGIVVERDDIVIDGNGYTLEGPRMPDRGGPQYEGVCLTGRRNVTVRNMQVTGFHRGFGLLSCLDISIGGNNIISNRYMEGIRFFNSSDSSIVGNYISSNWYGIWLMSSSNGNRIAENNITANHYEGIRLFSCSNNSIVDNRVFANFCDGIWLYYLSNNNNVTRNNIEANKAWGIRVLGSSGNTVNQNNFIDNYQQVLTDEIANCWDDGFEGNYWSDYNGTDSNEDGLGDMSYTMNGSNQDSYPLMNPFVPCDVNHDAHVDIADVAKIAGAFGKTSANQDWNPNLDVNKDNVIDVFDLVITALSFGKH